MDIGKIVDDAVEKAKADLGHFNILIAGRTGVGKSTLINAVFQADLATTGQGKPVTQNTREITKSGIPLTIFDSRGLEMAAYAETLSELRGFIRDRCSEADPKRHIHVAWVCIQEDGRRVEEAEVHLHQMLDDYVPVLGVITKARSDNGFRAEVQQLLPRCKNVARVCAIGETLDDGHEVQPRGLAELVEATAELIPEGVQKALAATQKANLDLKKRQAHKAVAASATAAAAAGASPIPFSDVAILAPIQVGMLASISAIFGIDVSRKYLTTLVASAASIAGASFAGRAIVANLIKIIPGGGSVVGGTVSAATASALTVILGEAFITVLAAFFKTNPGGTPDPERMAEELKRQLSKAKI